MERSSVRVPACRLMTQFLVPGMKALASFWPATNVDPASESGGYDYDQIIPGTQNGYLYRARVDYQMSDRTTFFISYQYGQDKAPSKEWRPHLPDSRQLRSLSGGGPYSSSFTKSLAGHFTHGFEPHPDDEFIASWGYGNFPWRLRILRELQVNAGRSGHLRNGLQRGIELVRPTAARDRSPSPTSPSRISSRRPMAATSSAKRYPHSTMTSPRSSRPIRSSLGSTQRTSAIFRALRILRTAT